jgi:hypothetical protein
MRDHEHPHPDILYRSLLCEASVIENRAVIRHLLSGCIQCSAVLQPIWRLGDRRARWSAASKPARRAVPASILRLPGTRA